jgi:paraquat-inducible protein B
MKDADVLKKKLTSARNNLMKANEPQFIGTLAHSKTAFLEIIKDFYDILSRIDYQTNKYATSNAVKKKIQESDVRNKLRELGFNLSNLDRIIESVFLVNLSYYQNHNLQPAMQEERKEAQSHI